VSSGLYVLDTSAILSGRINTNQENFIFPSSVLDEISLGKTARNIEWLREDLDIREPKGKSLEDVSRAARESGDFNKLSKTDLDVIALAMEYEATIITDDFAIENVASKLGIPYVGADLKEIRRIIKWNFRCTGCGRRFSKFIKDCPVCGHSIRRTVKSYNESGNESRR
jgi:UPF0271 protein